MTHPDTKPEALRLADLVEKIHSFDVDFEAAACLRRLHPFEAECERLKAICVAVHDRLLRGDDDRELLAMLEEAWKK